MNSIVPNLNLPLKSSSEELRICLFDGTVLLEILKKLRPGSVSEVVDLLRLSFVKLFFEFYRFHSLFFYFRMPLIILHHHAQKTSKSF